MQFSLNGNINLESLNSADQARFEYTVNRISFFLINKKRVYHFLIHKTQGSFFLAMQCSFFLITVTSDRLLVFGECPFNS